MSGIGIAFRASDQTLTPLGWKFDVLKAISLGARAVLIGRPILWGLCAGGKQGATNILEILRRELDEAMLLCGCTKLSDIDGSLLRP